MRMVGNMVRNLRVIIMLISGIIVSILGLIYNYDIKTLTITMIIVLAIFFIIGSIIQIMVNRVFKQVKKKEQQKNKKVQEMLDDENQDDRKEVDESEQPVEEDKID